MDTRDSATMGPERSATGSTGKPLAYLLAGTILFALGPAVLKLMTSMAGRFGVENPGALSFCNVLFVGNASAGVMTVLVFGARRLANELRRAPRRAKASLAASALVATVYPALIFTALEHTSVIDVVLLSRFNGLVLVVLAFVFFRTWVRPAEIVGYLVIAIGVGTLVVMRNGGLLLSHGEVLVLVSTVFFALTEIATKFVLRDCSIELYVFFRNLVSAIVFFVVAVWLYGFEHFGDALDGDVVPLLFLYAAVAVVVAQLFWLRAVRRLPVSTVAKSQLLNPVFSIFFAFVLLSEVPTSAEWLVMAVVAAGMLVPHFFPHESARAPSTMSLGTAMLRTH